MSDFSHIYNVLEDNKNNQWQFDADDTQRSALAERFDVIAVHKFNGSMTINPWGDDYKMTASYHAVVDQACVISGQPVSETIDEDFEIIIHVGEEPEDQPLDEEEMLEEDDIEYSLDGKVDVAEIFAQYLATGLNPFPRSEGVDISEMSTPAGVDIKTEEEVKEASNPFAALKDLKK